MAAKKAAAARRVAEELARQEKELNEWHELCDETDTSGKWSVCYLATARWVVYAQRAPADTDDTA